MRLKLQGRFSADADMDEGFRCRAWPPSRMPVIPVAVPMVARGRQSLKCDSRIVDAANLLLDRADMGECLHADPHSVA